MTKDEALKLALEALEDLGMKHFENTGEVLYKETFTAIKEALANEALERKAENARELGLNYEPEWTPERIAGMARLKDAQDKKLAQPEQEPVAWMHTKLDGVVVPHRPADLDRHPDRWEALYKNTPPCPTCEALARTVMMDQAGRDA